jgi:hypothetical protein
MNRLGIIRRQRSPIPLVSIVEAAADAASAQGLKRLGILGTRFTMSARFYPMTTGFVHVLTILLTAVSCFAGDRVEAVRQVDTPPQQTAKQEPELTPRDAAKIPPLSPINVTMHASPTAVTLTWEKSPGDDVVAFRIYRKRRDARLVKIGEVVGSTFVDRSPQRGSEYSITAVNAYGAESSPASAIRKKAKP